MSEGHVKDRQRIGADDKGVWENLRGKGERAFPPTRLCDKASLQTVKNANLRF